MKTKCPPIALSTEVSIAPTGSSKQMACGPTPDLFLLVAAGGRPSCFSLLKMVVLLAGTLFVAKGVAMAGQITTTNFISGVSIFEVSSEKADRAAVNIINGHGLNSTTLEHSTKLSDHLWESVGESTPSIILDLGAQHPLGLIRVWNYNSPAGNQFRGLKDVEIWVSPDTDTANFVLAQTVTFPMASGEESYVGEEISLSDFEGYSAVRLIKLKTISNHGNPYVSGLSEIRFSHAP